MQVPLNFHTTDADNPEGEGKIDRTLRNWSNRVTVGGLVVPADTDVSDAGGGTYDLEIAGALRRFRYRREAAFTFFGGEVDDANNTTLMGMHVSDAPTKSLSMRARGVSAVSWERVPGAQALKWPELWTDSDLYATHGPSSLKTATLLKTSSAPTVQEWDFAVPEVVTVTEQTNGWLLEKGARSILLQKAIAWDATVGGLNAPDVNIDFDDNVPVVSELTRDVVIDGVRYLRLRFTLDTSGATFPVVLDPEALITGDAVIQDDMCRYAPYNLRNYGAPGTGLMSIRNDGRGKFLIRFANEDLPAAYITSATIWAFCFAWTNHAQILPLRVAATSPWIEGAGWNRNAIDGEPSATYRAKPITWDASRIGVGPVVGIDTDADGGYAPVFTPKAMNPIPIPPAWVNAWLDGSHANEGVTIAHYGPATSFTTYMSGHPTLGFYGTFTYIQPPPENRIDSIEATSAMARSAVAESTIIRSVELTSRPQRVIEADSPMATTLALDSMWALEDTDV